MPFWRKLFGGGSPEPAGQRIVPESRGDEVGGRDPTHGIAGRPMPVGDDPEVVLPHLVGSFDLVSIDVATSKGASTYADYRRGRARVFVELVIGDDPDVARRALATAKAETDAEFPDVPQVIIDRDDLHCLRTANRLGSFMAWTRGRYYFSAHARGGEEDLNEFVGAFPY